MNNEDLDLDENGNVRVSPDEQVEACDVSATLELTYGGKAVGLPFNPSNLTQVDEVKQFYAAAIDRMNDLRNESNSNEQKRLCSIAITEAQTAQMWAVKALTWKD